MASKKLPKGSLGDIISNYGNMGSGTSGLGSLYGDEYGPPPPPAEGPPKPPRDRGYDIFAPAEGPNKPFKRPTPGLGEPGRERIRRELLPPPEEYKHIKQSTKGPYKTKRPDKYYEFWSAAAAEQSTRVYAAQWIPTSFVSEEDEDNTEIVVSSSNIVGDLFVAFARPSKGRSSLFVYQGVSQKRWGEFKTTSSFGKLINTLDTPVSYTEVNLESYKEKHPSHDWWIFDNLSQWVSIRPDNESLIGEIPKRGKLARVSAEAEKAVEKEIGSREEYKKAMRGF